MALRRGPALPTTSAKPAVPVDLIRIAIAGAMSVVLAMIATRAFDTMVWALVVPPLLVTVAAGLLRRHRAAVRWPVTIAAVPLGAVVAGLWSGGNRGDIASGFVEGWRRLLSTEWPSPRDPQVIVAVAFLLGLVAATTAELAGRRRLRLAPLAVMSVGLTAAMSIAAPRPASTWALIALGAGAAALMLLPSGEDARTRIRTLLGERSLPFVLVALAIAGIASSTALAWNDRADPRHTERADTTAALLDPIEEMIALRHSEPPSDLYRITDRSTLIGRSLPTRWRIAAFDEYDGQRWLPTVTLRPIGTRLGLPEPSRRDAPPPIAFDVDLLSDDFDLVPLPGRALTVDTGSRSGVETDPERTVVRLRQPGRPGTTVRVTAEVAPRLAAGGNNVVATRQVDETAGGLLEAARGLAGDGGTVLDQLSRIEQAMHERWSLDDNAPGGLQLALIERFVTEQQSGTEEQFVTAFVLMARSLGVDARVATGFAVPADELQAPLELRSTHAAAWPEVLLEGRGWLAYDPTPERVNTDARGQPPSPAAQSPAAAQPPILPPADQTSDDADQARPTETEGRRWGTVRTWLVRAGAIGGVAVLPFALVIGTVLVLKAVRRRRRLRTRDPARRIVGAWANTTDSLIDAGLTIAPAWTDQRIAESAETAVALTLPDDMHRLAANATAMTFGNTALATELVDDSVASWRTIEAAIRREMTIWERIRWRLSLRSLRRRTRTPVRE
jgi:uncharacterized membrane protein YjdF